MKFFEETSNASNYVCSIASAVCSKEKTASLISSIIGTMSNVATLMMMAKKTFALAGNVRFNNGRYTIN